MLDVLSGRAGVEVKAILRGIYKGGWIPPAPKSDESRQIGRSQDAQKSKV